MNGFYDGSQLSLPQMALRDEQMAPKVIGLIAELAQLHEAATLYSMDASLGRLLHEWMAKEPTLAPTIKRLLRLLEAGGEQSMNVSSDEEEMGLLMEGIAEMQPASIDHTQPISSIDISPLQTRSDVNSEIKAAKIPQQRPRHQPAIHDWGEYNESWPDHIPYHMLRSAESFYPANFHHHHPYPPTIPTQYQPQSAMSALSPYPEPMQCPTESPMAGKKEDGRTEELASSDLEEFSFINVFCPPAIGEPTRTVDTIQTQLRSNSQACVKGFNETMQ